MPVPFRYWRLSLRLAVLLAALSVCLATIYFVQPGSSARVVLPVFFISHALVSFWAFYDSFAAGQDFGGCGVGVGLWLWMSLEVMVLGGIWVGAMGGSH